jgi:hypothetical protein
MIRRRSFRYCRRTNEEDFFLYQLLQADLPLHDLAVVEERDRRHTHNTVMLGDL